MTVEVDQVDPVPVVKPRQNVCAHATEAAVVIVEDDRALAYMVRRRLVLSAG
jgi:hypothetical protein